MSTLKPWEINSELTMDKLCCLANIIAGVRHKALSLYEPTEGDGLWSLGCRIYERTINIIERVTKEYDWLKTIKNNLYFVILVDSIPIRYFRGDVESPNIRTLRLQYPEMEAYQYAFPFLSQEWLWRIVVETYDSGEVYRVVLVQYDQSGNHRNLFEIPFREVIPAFSSNQEVLPQPVEIEKPAISIKMPLSSEVVNGKQ